MNVFIIAALCASSMAGAQTPPTDLLRLPSLEGSRIKSTVVSLPSEVVCSPTDQLEDTIELRDLRFTQVQTSALRPQAIAPDSAVHAQLLKAARQHLQVPESTPLSKPQTLCELQELGAALSATYRSLSGLAAPIFVIDPQEVVDGVLHMQVLEAELESIELDETATDLDRDDVLKAMDAQLGHQQGQPMRQAELERGLALVQFITGRSYQAFLRPGDQPLGVKVRLMPKSQKKVQGFVRADNQGNEATGQTVGNVVLSLQSSLVQGDQLTVMALSGQNHRALNAQGLAYEMPLGLQGWRGGVRSNRSQYALGGSLAALQATGTSLNNSIYLQYPLLRSLLQSADLTLGVGDMDLDDKTISSQDHRLHSLVWTELRGNSKFGDALQTWGLGLTTGRLRYDTAEQAAADASKLNRQGLYHLLKLDIQNSQALGYGVDLLGSYKAQWASKNLDSFQKMGVGGSQGVRAFAMGESTGDQAHLVRLELGYSFLVQKDSHRMSVFYDWAQTDINQNPLAANAATNRVRIAGSGLQWEMEMGTGLSSRFYWAKPQGGDRTTSTVDNKSARVGAELNHRF